MHPSRGGFHSPKSARSKPTCTQGTRIATCTRFTSIRRCGTCLLNTAYQSKPCVQWGRSHYAGDMITTRKHTPSARSVQRSGRNSSGNSTGPPNGSGADGRLSSSLPTGRSRGGCAAARGCLCAASAFALHALALEGVRAGVEGALTDVRSGSRRRSPIR